MKIPNNWQGAKKQSYDRPKPNGYIVKIMNVKEEVSKNGNCYLKIAYDFAQGKYKDYWLKRYDASGGSWKGNLIMWHLTDNGEASSAFSNFIYCVEESNNGFVWDWNEAKLKNKQIGVVLREHEYIGSDGNVYTGLKADKWLTVADIANGNFKVKPIIRLNESPKEQPKKKAVFEDLEDSNDYTLEDDDIQF